MPKKSDKFPVAVTLLNLKVKGHTGSLDQEISRHCIDQVQHDQNIMESEQHSEKPSRATQPLSRI
ncbi:hypothetical protein SCLCIDRAFT_693959 [Scleroderma citrinum Foug A]|uniref:Uncharacterized protein n=1 Tax=Scleroderma citrinum Foug A TaxID=1036808 RepID=A0A0C2YMP4_9AGAM|nr:hypothetical protein SCLCIDRAFT_693959 [Scleroderma citrinum Foug A]